MKTSILLPVYNGSNYINKTILSILNQKGDWELIIQDDCSTDNTYEIVKNYLSEKVKYFKNSVSLKCFGTLNAAVANSSGELLRLFSHDDIMLENDIIICDKYLNDNKDIGLCFTNYDMIDENDNITSSSLEYVERNIEIGDKIIGEKAAVLLYKWGCISGSQSNITMRKEVYELIGGFNNSMLYIGDFYLLATAGVKYGIGYCKSKTCQIRFHAEQTSAEGTKSNLKLIEMASTLELLKLEMSQRLQKKFDKKFSRIYGYYMIKNPIRQLLRGDFRGIHCFVKNFGFKKTFTSLFFAAIN